MQSSIYQLQAQVENDLLKSWRACWRFVGCFFFVTQDLAKLYEVLEQARSPTGPGKSENWQGTFGKEGFLGMRKDKNNFLEPENFRTTPPPRMPVTTRIIPFFNFLVGNLNLNLCENWCFAVLLFSSRTFSGQAWRDGVWSICWEGVARWGDGFFRKPLKFKQICCLQERNS